MSLLSLGTGNWSYTPFIDTETGFFAAHTSITSLINPGKTAHSDAARLPPISY